MFYLFRVMNFTFLCLLLMISLIETAPRHCAECVLNVQECCVMLTEDIGELDKARLTVLLLVSSM